MGTGQQEGFEEETEGGTHHAPVPGVCVGLSLAALRLSWVVELGGRDAQQPAWWGLWYSLKGGVGMAPKATGLG